MRMMMEQQQHQHQQQNQFSQQAQMAMQRINDLERELMDSRERERRERETAEAFERVSHADFFDFILAMPTYLFTVGWICLLPTLIFKANECIGTTTCFRVASKRCW